MRNLFYNISKLLKIFPLEILIKISHQNIIFPFYHLISDREVVHIKHLYKIRTSKAFEHDLDFILKYYEPLQLTDLTDSLSKNKIKTNRFLLSFDDGLSEFHDVVAPILLRKGIPAICFLNSGFIDNKDLFFRYKASILIEKLQNSKKTSIPLKQIETWFEQKQLDFKNKCLSIRSINYSNKHLLDELAVLLEVDFHKYLLENKPYLTTEQIISLKKQGFLFGAHSIDHPLYSELDENQQLMQTTQSISEIATKFGIDYKIFSFPFTDFGVTKSFFDKIVPITDLTFGCAGLKKDDCIWNLQRIPMEIKSYSAQEVIYGEYLYYIFKQIFNKNTIKRY